MSEPAAAPAVEHADPDGLVTIDELSTETGISVRTVRYYASLGLIPAPERRGRVAFYGPPHRSRLELVRALQEHGFTLQAIEKVLARVPEDAGVDELALQRAMLTSWTAEPPEVLTRRQLERRAERRLSDDDLALLLDLGSVERIDGGDSFRVLPHLPVTLKLLGLDIPVESLAAAQETITRHMSSLVAELTAVLHEQVLEPMHDDTERLEEIIPQLRQLTLEAVVSGFQRAANDVITRSLTRTD